MLANKARHYELRLYDDVLLVFSVSTDAFGTPNVCVDEVPGNRPERLPLPLVDDPRSGTRLLDWLDTRVIPKNRRFVDQILAQAGIADADTFGILDVCLGLSVNDAYWVVPAGFSGTWAQYNLFENELDEVLALVAYTGYTTGQKRKVGLSTEWTTNGQYPKAWRRIDGSLVLYKAGTEGYANAGMEPYSEYFAAQAAAAFGIAHVPYGLEVWKGRLASTCRLMHGPDVAFVPFWTATFQSTFPAVLEAGRRVSPDVFEALRDMYVFDALVCNPDRHANNFGFLRSNATGELLGFAPLFDHNLALFPGDMAPDYPLWPKRGETMRPAGSNVPFDEVARLVMASRHHDALRSILGFRFENHPDHPVDDARLDALNAFISARVRQLLAVRPVDTDGLVESLRHVLPDDADIPAATLRAMFAC